VHALRALWRGEPVDLAGSFLRLEAAVSTPAPPTPPRVVVGIGGSLRTLATAVTYADELNVYAGDGMVERAREAAVAADRPISISVFLSWEWDKWPADPEEELAALAARGVDRVHVSIGAADMPERLHLLASIGERLAG
jgi:hypothetical protein